MHTGFLLTLSLTLTGSPDSIQSKTLEDLHILLYKGPPGMELVCAWDPRRALHYHIQSMEIPLSPEVINHPRSLHIEALTGGN